MKTSGIRINLFTVLVILLVPAFPVIGASSDWDRAVRIYGENEDLHPYTLEIISKTFDGAGKLEKTETQSFGLDYGNGFDNPDRELLKATENGRDVTEKIRNELEKNSSNRRNSADRESEGMEKHPLDPAVQEDVFAFDTKKSEYRNGRMCSVWSFEIELNDKYSGTGKVWIDGKSGAAVGLEYRIEPLFPFVERMNISMSYTSETSGRWLLEEVKMSGQVNMIIMKKSFESTMQFSDYR